MTHALLTAADERPYGFLKVRGPDLVREVELMAAAGFVQASRVTNGGEVCAVINHLTDSGHAFLHAFKDQPPIAPSEAIRTLASAEN